LAYALSPVSWMVTVAHGQFDAVVLFFVLGSARAWGKPGLRTGLCAGLWMGAAICFKHWPLILLPLFLRNAGDRRAGLGFAGAALMAPLSLVLPYVVREGLAPVWSHLSYTGVPFVSLAAALAPLFNMWFGGRGAQVLGGWEAAASLLFFMAWSGIGLGKRRGMCEGLSLMVLCFLVFMPKLSPQYLLWPLPFLALLEPAAAWRYTASAGLLLAAFYAVNYPEALDRAWYGGLIHLSSGVMWTLACLNFCFWMYTFWEWSRLLSRPERDPVFSA
jgi:hypothetical protein